MKKKLARRSRSEWKELVDQQEQSRQTIEAFCQAKGVSKAAVYYWRKKFKKEPAGSNGFVAVVPKSVSAAKILLRGRRGVEIEVPADVSMEKIQDLIAALSC